MSRQVLNALSSRFCQPEWSFAEELSLVPGFSSRRADAVAMNNWTSGKFACAIFGFEVKVSRSDFLHELKQPRKRAETYLGVDGLFLAVPAGLVRDEEVPVDMGIVTVSDAGARFKRMPTPCVLPGPESERRVTVAHPYGAVDLLGQPEQYSYTVRKLDQMPKIDRALAVAVLRAFHVDRVDEVTALRHRLTEHRSGLHFLNRDLHGFPEEFTDNTGGKDGRKF